MKRKFLETINSILVTLHNESPARDAVIAGLTEDGSTYPERDLVRLQEEITDRLSEFQ